jgi:hypothetical protein
MKKQSFFTRKHLLITIWIVFAAYCGIWSYVLIGQEVAKQRREHIVLQEKSKFNSLKSEERAVIKAQEYLEKSLKSVQPEQRLTLDYLQRKFDINETFAAEKSPIVIYKNPLTFPQEIHFLARIAYPNELVNQAPRSAVDGPTLTNIFSANCDHLSLPQNFWSTMEANKKMGGYYLTHTALALAFMKDNSCQIPPKETELLMQTIEGMVNLASSSGTTPDLRYEAVAFLGLNGRSDLIESSWIEKIVAEQEEDGSWLYEEDIKNSDHTTVLALWALLEYMHPNSPYEPIIRRASDS